jgi:hypothetical protein
MVASNVLLPCTGNSARSVMAALDAGIKRLTDLPLESLDQNALLKKAREIGESSS